MTSLTPIVDADALNAFLKAAFPGASDDFPKVVSIAPGRVSMVQDWSERMLRPGGVLSGPTLMSLSDTAAYAVVLAHIGLKPMAVTSGLNMTFLRGAKPGRLNAEAALLKLGRRLAVCDIRLWTESPDRLAAQATVTYALPDEPR
jgi:uncharacterized protein (TIGR00369 family)